MKKGYVIIGVLIIILLAVNFIFFSNKDKNVTGFAVNEGVSNKIEIKGSDTMLQLVSNMAEAYAKEDSKTKISVTGGGSGTGIASLINKEVELVDSSREIKQEELKLAKEKGINPVEVRIARDMLAVIVNKNNKVNKLTMEQAGKIYRGEIKNWKEVGGVDSTITLYGRQSTSGTYTFFMEQVVRGDYAPTMLNLEGNQAILEAVKQDKNGIGYVGLGYIEDGEGKQVDGINAVSISNGGEYFSPLDKTKIKVYPIARPLLQYLSKTPEKDSPIYNFIKFELSDQGQEIVKKSGFIVLTQEDKDYNKQVLNLD